MKQRAADVAKELHVCDDIQSAISIYIMEMRTERPRTAGRIAPTGRVTPTVHQTSGGRRKAIPVPPPRVPTPMPIANNNQQRNNANVVVPPTVSAASKKEPHENIARIAKRYLDDNMQQAWINPRLISMINMEAVTSTDYNSTNLSRNFNQVGFNTYNYSQFEEKYKPRQFFKYGDEYLEYGHKLGANERYARSKYQDGSGLDQRYSRSHSQPERQHQLYQETRSKSQDSRELTFYQIDPPVKTENPRQHDKSHQKLKKELTFYEIDGPPSCQERREKPEMCKERADKGTKSHDKSHAGGQERSQAAKHGKQSHQEQQKTLANASDHRQLNRSQSDLTESQLPNYCGHRNNPYIDPPKYRQFDRPPRYQEAPPRVEPPPKYHADPPKYLEVSRRQDDFKKVQQEERGRRQGGSGGGGGSISGGGGGGNSSGGRGNTGTHGAETPSNLASITPTAREATRAAIARQRIFHKTCDVRNNSSNNNNNNSKENLLKETDDDCDAPLSSRCYVEPLKSQHHHHHHHHHHQQQQQQQLHQTRGINGSNIASGVIVGNVFSDGDGDGSCGEVTTCDKYKGTGSESNRGSSDDAIQGRPSERSMLKIEKLSGKTALHGGESAAVGKCGAERMKPASQEAGYNKHEVSKAKSHDVGHGYKVENLRYYGELKGYADFKVYGTVDKQPASALVSAHEKSHLLHAPTSCEKGDKCHGKMLSSPAVQGYSLGKIGQQQSEKSHHSGDHYYHRSSHSKPPSAYQVYQETKYSYNVSGVPGTPAQASAAAAFFARAAQKLNLSSSPHRRRRSGDENIGSDELPIFPNGYAALLLKSPPPAPPALLRRIGVKELTGVGKVSPYRYRSLGGADDEVSVAILENTRP